MSIEMGLSPEPARGAVFLEQLKSVSLAMRREMIVFGVLLLANWAVFAWVANRFDGAFQVRPGMLNSLSLLAVLVPLFVWRAENPERRTYLWSLPISRKYGHLAKVASGWLWVMAAVALIVVGSWAMGAVTGDLFLERTFFAEPYSPGNPSGGFGWYTYQQPGWIVLVPFGTATFLYLVGSAIVIAADHPFRWGVGLYALLLVLALISAQTGGGEDGLLQRVMGNEEPYSIGALGDPEVIRPEMIPGAAEPVAFPRHDLSNWLSATAIWGGLALLAAYAAASRHREP